MSVLKRIQKLDKRSKRKLTYAVIFIIVLLTGVYVTTTPRPGDDFFQFFILGNNGLAADYFPNNSTGTISVGVQDNWTLNVINKFPGVQLVELEVKLGNLSSTAPNSTFFKPADLPVITTFLAVLKPNATWQIPFDWNISGSTQTSGYRHISLIINNESYSTSTSALNGDNFRFFFELWSASTPNTNNLHFGWLGREGDAPQPEAAWLQVYFNVTT
jgi:hypothetical protein